MKKYKNNSYICNLHNIVIINDFPMICSENPSTSKLVELKLFPKQTRERENEESSAAKRSRKD